MYENWDPQSIVIGKEGSISELIRRQYSFQPYPSSLIRSNSILHPDGQYEKLSPQMIVIVLQVAT